jgi:hypothetical protein
MVDTLTPNLQLTNQTEGGNANTWGIKADDNFEQIDDKLGDLTAIVTTGGTTVLTDEQELVAAVEVSGTLVSNATVEFSGRGGFWIVANITTGAFTVTVKVTGETGIEVAQGTTMLVWCDGDDIRTGAPPPSELVADTTPQLGGDLDANGHNIGFDDATGITDGGSPRIDATGDDTNIDLTLAGKGTGGVVTSFKQGTGLGLKDSDSSHDLKLKTSSNLTANRTLDLVTGDADRSVTIQGDVTLPAGTALVAGGVLMEPQGYLTPTSGTPIITSDASAATSVYYEPFKGNRVPLITSAVLGLRTFSALQLSLNNPNHVANTIYDVFLDWDGAAVRIGTGPAWTNSGAGTGARGTGAGTTQLERSSTHGLWVNAVQVSARNGASTYTIAAGEGLYVGSILIDSSAGQVTCHRDWGQSRKWGVWNAYNRQPLYLKAGDSTASWDYTTNTVRASRNQSANSLTVLQGLAEESYELAFVQRVFGGSGVSGNTSARNGIGWNSTTVASGLMGYGFGDQGSGHNNPFGDNLVAKYLTAPSLGINVVTALETAPETTNTVSWFGGEDDMVLSAQWRG